MTDKDKADVEKTIKAESEKAAAEYPDAETQRSPQAGESTIDIHARITDANNPDNPERADTVVVHDPITNEGDPGTAGYRGNTETAEFDDRSDSPASAARSDSADQEESK